jgi:hypothetical protein
MRRYPVQAPQKASGKQATMQAGRQGRQASSPVGACRLPQALVSRVCMWGTSSASAGSTQGRRWRSAAAAGGRRGAAAQQTAPQRQGWTLAAAESLPASHKQLRWTCRAAGARAARNGAHPRHCECVG